MPDKKYICKKAVRRLPCGDCFEFQTLKNRNDEEDDRLRVYRKKGAEAQLDVYRRLLRWLRCESGLAVREIEYYCDLSTSTLYGMEGGSDMRMTSFLRLVSLYLSVEGYAFDHRAFTQALEQAIRSGKTLRLTVDGADAPASGWTVLDRAK